MGLYSAIEIAENMISKRETDKQTSADLLHQSLVERIKKLYPNADDKSVIHTYNNVMKVDRLLSGLDNEECRAILQKCIKTYNKSGVSVTDMKRKALLHYIYTITNFGYLDKFIKEFI